MFASVVLFITVFITFFGDQYKGLENLALSNNHQYGILDEIWTWNQNFPYIPVWSDMYRQKIEVAFSTLEKQMESLDNSQAIIIDATNKYDTFYSEISSADDYKKTSSEKEDTIELWDWKFYLSFKDDSREQSIENEKYTIDVITKWGLYIDNSPRNLWFYSFDWVFKVHLFDTYTNKPASSFYIFPGMYVKWPISSKRDEVEVNSEVENELFYINNLQLTAKKSRISSESKESMYRMSFIYNPEITYSTQGVSEWLKDLLNTDSDFLDTVFVNEEKRKTKFKNMYSHLEKLENYTPTIFEDVQGYFRIFVNKSKKSIYYKNLVLEDLAKITKNIDTDKNISKIIGIEQEWYLDNIFMNLEELKSLSLYDYNQFVLFLNDYYYYYNYTQNIDFSTKFHISNMYRKLNGETKIIDKNEEYINHLFALYNTGEISTLDLNKWLMRYIVSVSATLDPSEQKAFYYYYYTYNKILANHLEMLWVQAEGFEDIIEILQNISFINKWYFTSEQVKKWMLYINIEIIDTVQKYISELYFEADRNADNLLVLKWNNFSIGDSTIQDLQDNLWNLYEYYGSSAVLNKNNEKELLLIERYGRLKNESEEYFRAIMFNDAYINAKRNAALAEIAKYNSKVFEEPTVSWVKTYLSEFVQVDIRNAKIEVIDEVYYVLEDVWVWNEIISFELYPLEFNKLTKIKKKVTNSKTFLEILWIEEEQDFTPKNQDTLTIDELYRYFISLWNIEVYKQDIILETSDKYVIKNINIWGLQYSFSLTPKAWNEVTDVMEWLWVTYKLDNIKPDEDARDRVKTWEDYKNFFVNLLIKNQEEQIVMFKDNEQDEDSVEISIFKTDQLFWTNGNFSVLKGIVAVSFDNVEVNVDGWKYTTILEDIVMLPTGFVEKTERWETVQGRISAYYNVGANPRNFNKIKLDFNFVRSKGDDIRKDFGWTTMVVAWEVAIDDFKDFHKNLWSDYIHISNFYQTKERILWEGEITRLIYSAKNREALISFEYKSAPMTVTFKEWKILELKYRENSFTWSKLNNVENLIKSFL